MLTEKPQKLQKFQNLSSCIF